MADEFLLENGQPDLKKINKLLTKIKIPYMENNVVMCPLKYNLFGEYCLRADKNLSMKDFVKDKFPNIPKKYIKEIVLAIQV